MDKSKCPICHSDVMVNDEIYENDLVTCNNCGRDLEVVSLHPLVFRKIDDEESAYTEISGEEAENEDLE